MTSIAQWHACQPAWYFRAGEPFDGVEAYVGNDEIALSGAPRFGNKLAFTSRCTVLDAPSRHFDDPTNPPFVSLAGGELLAFLAQARERIRTSLCGMLPEEVPGACVSARISDYLRFKRWYGGEIAAWAFPPPGSVAVVMGIAKPYIVAGRWGLSVTIFEIEELL